MAFPSLAVPLQPTLSTSPRTPAGGALPLPSGDLLLQGPLHLQTFSESGRGGQDLDKQGRPCEDSGEDGRLQPQERGLEGTTSQQLDLSLWPPGSLYAWPPEIHHDPKRRTVVRRESSFQEGFQETPDTALSPETDAQCLSGSELEAHGDVSLAWTPRPQVRPERGAGLRTCLEHTDAGFAVAMVTATVALNLVLCRFSGVLKEELLGEVLCTGLEVVRQQTEGRVSPEGWPGDPKEVVAEKGACRAHPGSDRTGRLAPG
uniref:Uncharacterized protein n=1 Tax=Rangifer tarandus platyrhynchus TaxID=3082113 RepID=A0ACB0EP74_RANTA|nr:unnamed protein product [Rangifer tarandus platyrhynchus]